jgi:PPP family 3-phenylpropionic acid transporter
VRAETVILVTLFAAALRFVVIGWWVASLPLLLFAQLLHALTFGAYHASAIGLVHRYFRGRNQARGQALYNSLAFGIGGSLGSLYSGAAWDGLGGTATFTLAGGLALLAALAFSAKGRTEVTPGRD